MAKMWFCEDTRRLIDYAKSLGFHAERTPKGHLKFVKEGRVSVYSSGTPSDRRALLNAQSNLRRADRGAL